MKSKKKEKLNQPTIPIVLMQYNFYVKKVSSSLPIFFGVLFLINFQFINNKLHDLFMYLLATRLFNFYCLRKQLCNCRFYTTVMALKYGRQVYIQLVAQTVLTSIHTPIPIAFSLHTSLKHYIFQLSSRYYCSHGKLYVFNEWFFTLSFLNNDTLNKSH